MASPIQFNPWLKDLQLYQGGRPIEEVARELGLPAESIIKMASNENPIGPSPAALAAMQKVVANLNLYPDGNAFYLKRRLAEKFKLKPENFILGNGSSELIEFIGHGLMAPGVDVVISQYAFLLYLSMVRLFAANAIIVPARDYGHDLPAMLAAITPRTKIVFVSNPNNPTGTLASPEELLRFVNAVPEHILLVIDEAYIDFLDEPVDLVPLIRDGKKPNLLLMRTFSKIFGLAGLRIGYGIAMPELVSAFEVIRAPFNINSIAQAGALAALDDDAHKSRTRANNNAGLKLLADGFRAMKLEFVPSVGNFILVRVGDAKSVFENMQKEGVIVRPMAQYDLVDWIRITVGTPSDNQRCLDALKKVLRLK